MCNNSTQRKMEILGTPHRRRYKLNIKGKRNMFILSMTASAVTLTILAMLINDVRIIKLIPISIICIASLGLAIKYMEE